MFSTRCFFSENLVTRTIDRNWFTHLSHEPSRAVRHDRWYPQRGRSIFPYSSHQTGETRLHPSTHCQLSITPSFCGAHAKTITPLYDRMYLFQDPRSHRKKEWGHVHRENLSISERKTESDWNDNEDEEMEGRKNKSRRRQKSQAQRSRSDWRLTPPPFRQHPNHPLTRAKWEGVTRRVTEKTEREDSRHEWR